MDGSFILGSVCPGSNEYLCLPDGVITLSGLSLIEYAAVLASAEQVVANDSGPMHLASAVGASVLGVFGVTDPQRTSPLGGDVVGDQTAWPTVASVLALEHHSSVRISVEDYR